jgi:hypothetical protein
MKVKSIDGWAVQPGKTKTVYDRETGAPSEEVVSPWSAQWLGGNGTATLYGASEEALKRGIAGHPFTSNPPAGPEVVKSGVTPDADSLEARVAALEAAAK